MEALLSQLSRLIVSRRKELNIKQEDLSDLTNIAIRTIRDLEKGRGNPSLETLEQLMAVLGIDLIFKLKK
jgi:transcriptional regulator with XRE-family HTH domain